MNKSQSIFVAVIVGLLTGGTPTGVSAQEDGAASLAMDEITVFARKREENLQDVPVSISVISEDFMKEAGVFDMFDLYENVPGIQYNQDHDRQGVRAAVRGVQGNTQNPVRAKVTSFLDGVPMVGQTGALQFQGVDRVEVMRGPQSAAFGRATFAGAINYVSKNPGDEFESEIYVAASDLERNVLAVSVSGPITDTLGYIVSGSFDEYRGADDWVTTEGLKLGPTETQYLTAKLVWEPSDSFDMNLRVMHLETDDAPPLQWNIPLAALDACTNFVLPDGRPYVQGEWKCDPSIPSGGAPQNLHPEETLIEGTPEHYQAMTFSVLEPGSYVKRDRIQAEFNFSMSNDSLIQVLVSHAEDELRRWFDVDRSNGEPVFMGGMIVGGQVRARANPNNIDENYAEVRWVSPGDQSVRWLVGASVFDYDFLTRLMNQLAGEQLGLEDEANGGEPFNPVTINSDIATNTGIFGNVTWDISDRTTVSAEVRLQRDDITNESYVTGAKFTNVTDSVQPRLAINHAINDNWSAYGQFSQGTNPSGVNISFLDDERQASLEACTASGFCQFDTNDFLAFDEETITNYEIGIKGSALNNQLQLAASIYFMDWEDMIQPNGIDWDGDWNDGSDPVYGEFGVTGAGGFQNTGDGELQGIELEANWRATDNWRFRAAATIAKAEFSDSCLNVGWGYENTDLIEDTGKPDCYRVDGNDLYRQPDNTLSASSTFSNEIGAGGWDWSWRLGVRYSSREYLDVLNLAYLPAKTLWDTSVSFRNDNWNLTVFGSNLSDVDTPNNVQFNRDWQQGSPSVTGFNIRPRQPREIGLRVRYDF